MTLLSGQSGQAQVDWRAPVRRLRDRLSASDPALSRLRLATRAMLALAINVALLAAISFWVHPLPFAAFGLSFVISFNGTLAIRDKGSRAQAVTRGLSWIAAIVAVAAASLLSAWPLLVDAAFLCVIFAAVYARRHGARWTAVGMIGFMAFFMGDYLRPDVIDLPWIAIAAAIAFAVTQVVTNLLLADDPERDFRRALASVDVRIAAMLRQMLEEQPIDRDKMQKHLGRLRDVVMMAEGFIPQGEDGALAARGAASDLAIALFDLQLMAERLTRMSYTTPPPRDVLRTMLAGGAPRDQDDMATRLLVRVKEARGRVEAALAALPSPFAAEAGLPPPPRVGASSSAGWVPAYIKAPIQVTLACAIAMGIGLAVSPSRWYWAVITAFIVFNNTKSRADTAVRALQRSLGTFAGLIGGTILATLLHGQPIVAGLLMPVCFFFAFYYLQVSYSVMIFFITLALALLYGLTGSFSPELLLLRLEETVVGGAAGVLVAFLVFPARTADGASAALEKYLSALGDVVAAAKGRATGDAEPLHLLARSRLLDRSYADLATSVRPIGGPWSAVTRFGEVRERLLLLSAIAHWARVLGRSLPPGVVLSDDQRSRVIEVSAEMDARLATARAQEGTFFERPKGDQIEALHPRPPVPIGEEADPALAMEVISSLLERATPVSD